MMYMHHSCTCTTLRKASRAITRLYDARLAGHGMTTTQFAVLRNLRGGEMPLSRLAEQLVMDRTSLYRTLAPIERSGWIEIGGGTGRTKLARLTDAGRAAMIAAMPDWEATQHQVIGELGAEEWRKMTATLDMLAGMGPA